MPHNREVITREQLAELDRQDLLAGFRSRFAIPEPDLIYLDGNSLGRMPLAATDRMNAVAHEWARGLIRSWGEGWMDLPHRIGDKIAKVIGAGSGEVLLADSTTVCLYKLVTAALRARPERTVIVTDDLNFPSDLYILQEAASQAGGELRIVQSQDGLTIDPDELDMALGDDVALVSLSHTAFKSGFLYDGKAVTEMAHRFGAWVLWDLSHSAGAVPVALNEWGADMAVGCTYKYLNGGPGAPAYLCVKSELHPSLRNPIPGWLGHDDPFSFDINYRSKPGIGGMSTGTPPIFAMAMVEPGIDLVLEAGVDALRQKSMAQTDLLVRLWEEHLAPLGVALRSPRAGDQRGSHVSLGHPDGLRIARWLIEERNVIPDFRKPDSIRLGVTPLYTTYTELFDAVKAIKEGLESGGYRSTSTDGISVT